MKRLQWIGAAFAIVALISPVATFADEKTDNEKKARELGLQAEKALNTVLKNVPEADALYQASVGWAYFDMTMLGSTSLVAGRGTGHGVIMTAGSRTGKPMSVQQKETENQVYEFVFFFQTKAAFEDFLDGWDGGDTAKASARNAGLDVNGNYVNGIKVYQIVDKGGLTEVANIATTKFKAGFHK